MALSLPDMVADLLLESKSGVGRRQHHMIRPRMPAQHSLFGQIHEYRQLFTSPTSGGCRGLDLYLAKHSGREVSTDLDWRR